MHLNAKALIYNSLIISHLDCILALGYKCDRLVVKLKKKKIVRILSKYNAYNAHTVNDILKVQEYKYY